MTKEVKQTITLSHAEIKDAIAHYLIKMDYASIVDMEVARVEISDSNDFQHYDLSAKISFPIESNH